MQKNIITNKITPCCGLPFSVIYWWVSNLTLNSEADREFIISKISQNGTITIDGWKVLVNSGTLEADASLTKAEFLAWFNCGRQPSCEQLKLIIEGYKVGNWTPETELPSNLALIDKSANGINYVGNVYTKEQTDIKIADGLTYAYLGIATTTTTPPATGAFWYRVDEAGTYTNFLSGGSPIMVSAGDLDGNDVFLEVKDNVATKRVRLNNEKGAKEIKVSVTENGNNAIQNAINSIEKATKERPVNIRVKAGIYKASNSTDFTANNTYPAFILPKDNVNIIGDSAEDCIIWAELPYNDGSINRAIPRYMHQTVYNWADNSTFENLTIVAKNIRYAIHQDNPNEANKTRYYKNCNFRFLGDKGFLAALGIGTYSGSRTYVEGGGSFSEYTAPFACHNNQKFENPSLWSFKNHTFSTVEQSIVINMENSGSLISDIAHFENCSVEGGFIFKYSNVYIYTPNFNDSFNHANWKITGSGNNPMCFINDVLGKGLKVEANTVGHHVRFDTNSSAYPLIIANNKNYFGNLGHPERKIQDKYIVHDYYSRFKSYAIGCMSIQEDDYPYGTTTSQDRLGLRLGDCSTVNKTLGIIINDVIYNVVFNKNYTDFTNAQIIAEINAVLGSAGVASEYIIGRDYYPEFTDVNYKLRNDSSESILKGTLVSRVGTGVKKATTGDIVFGIAIDDIEPSWKTGEGVYYGFGRIIKKMIFHTDKVLKEPGVVIEKNKKYSALSGKLIEDINGNLIGFDDDYLLIP